MADDQQLPAESRKVDFSIAPPRFPYSADLEKRFGIDKSSWRALTDAIFPNAKTIEAVVLALSYCKARRLDVFKKPVHIVPMWSSELKCLVDTVWPGIGELRTTASRTGLYAGCDATIWGPDVQAKYGPVEVIHPEWAEKVVYKVIGGTRCAFHGPRVYWRETYATKKHDTDEPNTMWKDRPYGQIEKCAEAGALRLAFPEELGGEYAAEEMEGKTYHGPIETLQAVAHPKIESAHAQKKNNKDTAFDARIDACTDHGQLEALLESDEFKSMRGNWQEVFRDKIESKMDLLVQAADYNPLRIVSNAIAKADSGELLLAVKDSEEYAELRDDARAEADAAIVNRARELADD